VIWFSPRNDNQVIECLRRQFGKRAEDTIIERHHYLNQKQYTAKLYESGPPKNQSSNQGQDIIYKAINQSINSMVNFEGKGTLVPPEQLSYKNNLITLEMPVVICNAFSKFFRTDFDGDNSVSEIEENFLMEVNYAYSDSNKTAISELFLVDFVSFQWIDKYMEKIDADEEMIRVAI